MLELVVEDSEWFDETTNEFYPIKGCVLRLEHSLVSISKWESKWKVPFLSREKKTYEQTLDYIKCMTINQNVKPETYLGITNDHIRQVNEYISDEKTATTFKETNNIANRQVVTSELIYFWMAQFNIPMECQKWHFSRLITLLRVASIKNTPEKKMSRNAILSQNRSLNAARRKALKSKG